MSTLEFARYRLVLRPRETIRLPEYKGATFRGGFGTVFQRITCVCGSGATVHQRKCLYAQVFETPYDGSLPALPRTARLPHPFVLEPPLEIRRVYAPGECLGLHLVLIGRALEWLPYFIFTFEELGRVGMGQSRGSYGIEEVLNLEGQTTAVVAAGNPQRFRGPGPRVTLDELWTGGDEVQAADVQFLTYTRVMGRGRLQESVAFPLLFGALLRRLALLMYAHSGEESFYLPSGDQIEAADVLRYFYDRTVQRPEARSAIRDAFRMAEQVTVATQKLRWEDWERYSTRQDVRMRLGGVVGSIRYVGPLSPFLPYLRVGEYIHVGKNTAFGLGQMVVQVSAQ